MKRLAMMAIAIVLGTASAYGCVAPVPVQQAGNSILTSSSPAAGSTVRAPVDALKLRFNPPARLDEVTINGPDGVMPAMVHSIGEIADYSIPLSGLGAGSYVVSWRATARGLQYRGNFQFKAQE